MGALQKVPELVVTERMPQGKREENPNDDKKVPGWSTEEMKERPHFAAEEDTEEMKNWRRLPLFFSGARQFFQATDVPALVRCHIVDTEPRRLRLESQKIKKEEVQIFHPWFENRDLGRVMASTREISRCGGGPMAQPYVDSRGIRK